MSETISRLQELLARKENLTAKMDSFQIAQEIEQTVTSILQRIFDPYLLGRVTTEDLTRTPDLMLTSDFVGRSRKLVFFEIKAGEMADYDLKTIREMMRELKAVYGARFYSLVFIAKSFNSRIVSRIDKEKERYLARITLIPTEILVSFYRKLTDDPRFLDPRHKQLLLANLLETEGIINAQDIFVKTDRWIDSLPKEYSFETLRLSFPTSDGIPLNIDLSLEAVHGTKRLGKHSTEEEILSSESVKELVSRETQKAVLNHSLLEFAFETEQTKEGIRQQIYRNLQDYGFNVVRFEFNWKPDENAAANISEKKAFLDRSNSLLREINQLNNQLTRLFSNLDGEVSKLRERTTSLESGYVHGMITKNEYLEQTEKVGKDIDAFKARLANALRNQN